MIVDTLSKVAASPIFYHMNGFVPNGEVFLKLEGLNIAGSIKFTTAQGLIAGVEKECVITSETKFIESSSGNLGVALSILCKEKNYPFYCVVDPNILPENERLMELYGARLIKVVERDRNGGYQGTRKKTVEERLREDPHLIWFDQHASQHNASIHYERTAPEIFAQFDRIDYLFIGTGSSGTLMGCSRFFKKHSPKTKIIAVDSLGSAIFSSSSAPLSIPGMGMSERPALLKEDDLDEIIHIKESDAIQTCRYILDAYGLCLGGSSGGVLHAVQTYRFTSPSTVVAIAADFGYKYLDLIYGK